MSRRNKLTNEERISAVQEYIIGEGSYRSIAKKYGIDHKLLRMLVGRTQTYEFQEKTDSFAALIDRVTFRSFILNMNCSSSYRIDSTINND